MEISDGWIGDYIPDIMLFHRRILVAICDPEESLVFCIVMRLIRCDFDESITLLIIDVFSPRKCNLQCYFFPMQCHII